MYSRNQFDPLSSSTRMLDIFIEKTGQGNFSRKHNLGYTIQILNRN